MRGCLGRISPSRNNNETPEQNLNIVTIGGGNNHDRKKNFLARQNNSPYKIEDISRFSDSDFDPINTKHASWADTRHEDEEIDHTIRITATVTQKSEVEDKRVNIPMNLWGRDVVSGRKSSSEGKAEAGSMV